MRPQSEMERLRPCMKQFEAEDVVCVRGRPRPLMPTSPAGPRNRWVSGRAEHVDPAPPGRPPNAALDRRARQANRSGWGRVRRRRARTSLPSTVRPAALKSARSRTAAPRSTSRIAMVVDRLSPQLLDPPVIGVTEERPRGHPGLVYACTNSHMRSRRARAGCGHRFALETQQLVAGQKRFEHEAMVRGGLLRNPRRPVSSGRRSRPARYRAADRPPAERRGAPERKNDPRNTMPTPVAQIVIAVDVRRARDGSATNSPCRKQRAEERGTEAGGRGQAGRVRRRNESPRSSWTGAQARRPSRTPS